MSKRTISLSLSDEGISHALKELEQYSLEFERKCEELQKRIAAEIGDMAQNGFNGAIVDDLLAKSGGARQAAVSVSVDDRGDAIVVIAYGEDAVWVEFGAGVYHNGAAGQSPHPSGSELGMTIGGYGNGHGRQKTWGYYEGGNLRLTHGTPASMPMYNAMRMVCNDIARIAAEVFS